MTPKVTSLDAFDAKELNFYSEGLISILRSGAIFESESTASSVPFPH